MSLQRRSFAPRYGWIPVAGTVLMAAWVPLLRLPSGPGAGVLGFLASFCTAGLAYVWALRRLPGEEPPSWVIWAFALACRALLLFVPLALSNDVYRYIWDGHLLNLGLNPYALAVASPQLDAYATPLRAQVGYAWMSTPYLPAAQVYFAAVERIAPQSVFAFQLGAALAELAAAGLVQSLLPGLGIPRKAILVTLWNPLMMVEFARGAHVDALMLLLLAAALWGVVRLPARPQLRLHRPARWAAFDPVGPAAASWARATGLTLSALALAAAVLVKGWPALAAPLFFRRWGWKRTLLFCAVVLLPLAAFAAGAGWGLVGPLDGTGVFGALRIYAASWTFNAGLYLWIAKLVGPGLARLVAVAAPGLAALALAWSEKQPALDSQVAARRLLRRTVLVLGLYLALSPTVHPWYLTLVLGLLPFFWPSGEADAAARRWIAPWTYFIFLEAFTYLSYAGIPAPSRPALDWIQTLGYLPFWLLCARAVWPRSPLNHQSPITNP